MCYWTGDIAAETISLIGDRIQAEFGIEFQPVSSEIDRLLARLRAAERLTRIRNGF